jgi:hypothetical protein
VRALRKGTIAVLLAALVCAARVPGASAAEAPEEGGGVFLELSPRKQARVVVEIHPQLGVALVYTEMGPETEARPHRPRGTVDYAVRIPKRPIEGRLDLKIPGVLSIEGEIALLGEEDLEFNGSLRFTGKGGYLRFDIEHAIGKSASGRMATCFEACPGANPSLFDYFYPGYPYSTHNTQVLLSERSLPGRLIRFRATHAKHSHKSAFQADDFEWLPGQVASARMIEVVGAPYSAFQVSSTAEHPLSARVKAPAPFFGSATYSSAGDIRSPATGGLIGTLSVDIFGVKIRLAGPRVKAGLVNLNPGL